jgi:hypothetical protein
MMLGNNIDVDSFRVLKLAISEDAYGDLNV